MPISLSLHAGAPADLRTALLAVALAADEALPDALAPLDATLGGAMARALARRDFRGARDETLFVGGADRGAERVLLVGMGKVKDRAAALKRAGAVAGRAAVKLGTGDLAFHAADLDAAGAEAAAVGIDMAAFRYDDLRTQPPEAERRAPLERATLVAGEDARPALAAAEALGAGYALARRLAMMPGNVCTPETFVETAHDIAERHGMTARCSAGPR
jgi:leucyl aminopeptidase